MGGSTCPDQPAGVSTSGWIDASAGPRCGRQIERWYERNVRVAKPVARAGGVSHLRLDGRRHEQVAGDRRFVGDRFAESPDRYEIEVLGGASRVDVGPT